jgi:integrase
MIDAAGVSLKAMLLLGIDCGFGNSDCASLPLSALDLDGGWITYPRPKTGIERRCPLWPETVAALREVLARRHEPKNAEHAGLDPGREEESTTARQATLVSRCGEKHPRNKMSLGARFSLTLSWVELAYEFISFSL